MQAIGINGITGRMGRLIAAAVTDRADCQLVGGLSRQAFIEVNSLPADLRALDLNPATLHQDPAALCAAAEVIIDFSLPPATMALAEVARATGTGLVIGTTGLSAREEDRLAALTADGLGCVFAPNMGLGINVLLALVARAARALDPAFDIEIVEMHHGGKVDAPSGTALGLGRAAAAGRDIDLADAAVRSRDGHTGARVPGSIGFATLRGGDVVGEHSVIFAGPGERIELSHKAGSRTIFANGAVAAARWLGGKPAGLYSMRDVLNLTD